MFQKVQNTLNLLGYCLCILRAIRAQMNTVVGYRSSTVVSDISFLYYIVGLNKRSRLEWAWSFLNCYRYMIGNIKKETSLNGIKDSSEIYP